MGGSFRLAPRLAAIALGACALLWQPSAAWIEAAYSNGAYPVWEHAAFAVTDPFPWSLGDVAVAAGIVAIVWRLTAWLRSGRRRSLWTGAVAMLDVLVVLAIYAVWFELSWGWNYARAPIETRLQFDAARVTPANADRLRAQAMAQMNALAAIAHARASQPLDLDALSALWLPVVQRGGDRWTPAVGPAKPTLFDPFMAATGTSGFVNPLTLTVQTASDLFWFERPFDMAHEWSHVAAYAREDEANYIAIVTCRRSTDPVVRYSGWFELFLYLPQKRRYRRSEFSPLVWRDFAAMRERDARRINVLLARWSWHTYNVYLKSNRIASGVQNYNEVTRLVLGIPLDAAGLPRAK
ncbi:MAG TPA: DUF3810 family protein [Candidatus Acidoferrales bacterium]|nr:DUF3810 family protein [Candidatus Acidoferrales bacterium]